MRTTLLFILFILSQLLTAQNCVTIESILVDSCTLSNGCQSAADPTCNCEGKNEMFRFKVGNNPLNTGNMVINWPNNDFLGLCQNATSAQVVSILNQTVEACGVLVEPVNGILPAGASVLVITSTDVCTAANSFANLSDTLYVLFQCPGNYTGHFANFGSGMRSMSIGFGGGCNSFATYDRSQLITQTGLPAAEDGAAVNFSPTGVASYYNNGCSAPVPTPIVSAGSDEQACPGDVLQLSATAQGNFLNYSWSGGSGTFGDANSLQTTYQLGTDDVGNFDLTFSAENCNGWINSTITVFVSPGATTSINPVGPLEICPGESVELTASSTGTGQLAWSNGDTGNSTTVNSAGTYTVTISGGCGQASSSVVVTVGTTPQLSISPAGPIEICGGEEIELTAQANGNVLWNNGETTNNITVSEEGTYTATFSNSCGSANESVTVSVLSPPVVSVNPIGPVELCAGTSIQLTATGNGDFEWNTGATSASIEVSNPGIYTIATSNNCGEDEATVEVIDGGTAPTASIEIFGLNELCPGETTQLIGSGNGSYQWNTGSQNAELTVNSGGNYFFTVTNECGSNQASVYIAQINAPAVLINQGEYLAICDDAPVTISAVSNTPVFWSNGFAGNSFTTSNTGSYYAYTENQCGVDTAFIEVVTGNVEALFSSETLSGAPPLALEFTNLSTGAQNYQWAINGSNVSQSFDFNTTLFSPGVYNISLNSSDSLGCYDIYHQLITVEECIPQLFVPNAFTPNGDGINDLFFTESICISSFDMVILNRWGNEVFRGTELDKWDGNGGPEYYVTDGIYVYTINYTDLQGRNGVVKGSVTVLR
jgi:gliding motility-associated-like protein